MQYRTKFDNVTSQLATLAVSALPLYVEIQRVGDQYQAATSTDGTTYTLIPGSTVSLTFPDAIQAGLAASSSVSGSAAQAVYSNVSVAAATTPLNPAPSADPCPTGWSCQDVGNPNTVGDQILANGTWTLKGAGQAIAGYNDQFHSVWQSAAGNVVISARLATQTNVSNSTAAGLMLRQSTSSLAPYYAILVTPTNGIRVQVRFPYGPDTVTLATVAGTAPAYVSIARYGNTLSAYTSTDGVNWTYVPTSSINVTFPTTMLAGMAVTSGQTTATSTATFDRHLDGSWRRQ